MEKYAHPLLGEILKIDQNKHCFDCGIANPNWASVNNAVFICINCAGDHRGFGVNISFVRSLTMDSWDDKQIRLLMAGGNGRLKAFLEEYSIPLNTNPELKYKLSAVDYYRKRLRAEVFDEPLPEKPDSISALVRIDDGIKKDLNFNNNNYISSASYVQEPSNKPKPNFFSKVGNFFGKSANEIGGKIKEMKIGHKAKEIGKHTAEKAYTIGIVAGGFVTEKSKEVANSKVVKGFVERAKNIFKNKDENGDEQNSPQNENRHAGNFYVEGEESKPNSNPNTESSYNSIASNNQVNYPTFDNTPSGQANEIHKFF